MTNAEIEALEPREKPYKIFESNGFHFVVYPTGTIAMRLKYYEDNKEKLLTIGKYGEVKVKDARKIADTFRLNQMSKQLELRTALVKETADNIDPEFCEIACLWVADTLRTCTKSYIKTVKGLLERHIFPTLKGRLLSTIRVKELYDLLSGIQKNGLLDTGCRALSFLIRIFNFAAAQGYVGPNPCLPIQGQLISPNVRAMPAATDEFQLMPILQRLDEGNRSSKVVMLAIRCSFHWFCRPIELRTLKWTAVNFELNRLELTAAKSKKPHLIPLTAQTREFLEQLKFLAGDSPYVFQSPTLTDQPISENTCNNALRLLGIENDEMVMHGVRATAMTLLRERFDIDEDVIQLQLAHTIKNKTRKAYDRSRHLKSRIRMMKKWSEFLVDLAQKKVDLTELIGDI